MARKGEINKPIHLPPFLWHNLMSWHPLVNRVGINHRTLSRTGTRHTPSVSWPLLCILVLWSSYPIGRKKRPQNGSRPHRDCDRTASRNWQFHLYLSNKKKRREGEKLWSLCLSVCSFLPLPILLLILVLFLFLFVGSSISSVMPRAVGQPGRQAGRQGGRGAPGNQLPKERKEGRKEGVKGDNDVEVHHSVVVE